MKRKSRFLIGFTTAAITFATLFALVGRPNFHHKFNAHHGFNGKCQMHENEPTKVEKETQPAPEVTVQ